MKLDAWQQRLAVRVLEAAADARRARRVSLQRDITRGLERKALESMAAALESGESLEVGP